MKAKDRTDGTDGTYEKMVGAGPSRDEWYEAMKGMRKLYGDPPRCRCILIPEKLTLKQLLKGEGK